MCLAVPMVVTGVAGSLATCEARGVTRQASLFLIADEAIGTGDHVLVQNGHVTQRISATEAAETWALYDEIFAAEQARAGR